MDDFEPAKKIFEKVSRKYEENPKGWKVLVKADQKRYPDILITNPREAWQIKLDSLYKPGSLGMGMKLERKELRGIDKMGEPHFGFRPLPTQFVDDLMYGRVDQSELLPMVEEILKHSPARLSDIDTAAVVQGPIHYGWKGYLSERQELLDRRLERSLDKLLFKKGYGLPYR